MGKQNKRPSDNRATAPGNLSLSDRASTGEELAVDPNALSAAHWLGLVALLVSLLLVVLGLTPFTHNLDDLKVLLFFTSGPLLMLLAMWMILTGRARPPHKLVAIGLGAYYIILLLSVALSDFSWVGIHQIFFVWSAAGYFLLAHCVASHERGGNIMLRALVLLLFVTNCVGMFMYDFRSHPDHKSGMALLFNFLYGNPPKNTGTPLFDLFYTLKFADRSMQSTILNRDFYAAFCLLYLPLAILLSIDPGRTRHPLLWRSIGFIAVTFSIICIFLCKSKGEYIFGAVVFMMMLAGIFIVGDLPRRLKKHVVVCVIGLMIMVIGLGIVMSPTLLSNLKSLPLSFSSRSIIWTGSMKIFQEFPVLGSGPGTFRIYFPQFRAPDYFDNEISHVTLYSHNYFFDLLAETGVLGFAAYILFLGTIWIGCMRNAFTHPSARIRLLCLAAAVALVGMYGSNLTSPNARWVIGGSSLWTVLGFASGLLTRANFSRRQESLATPTALGWAGNSKLLYIAATVGTIMFIFSFREATSYWKGSVFYADGLRRMDPVYNAMQSGAQPNAKMTQLLEESLTYFNKAVKAYPNHVSSYYKMGSAYTNLYSIYGSRRQAAQNPKERENLEYQANIYLERAKDAYEKLTLELYPDYAEIHYNMGVIYPIYAKYLEEKAAAESDATRKRELLAQAADYEARSVKHLEKMVTMSLREEVAMRAGMEFMKQGKTTRTLEVFRDAAKEHPKSEQLNRYYYQVASNAASPEDVAEANANLWRMEPANYDYFNALVVTCFNAELFDRAEAIAKELEAINPVDPRIQEIRIISAAEQGDDPKVLELWRKYRVLEEKDMKICKRIMEIAARLDDAETLKDIQSMTGLTTESLTTD